MIGYKIAAYYDKEEYLWKPCMVTLEIPDDAQVVRPYEVKTIFETPKDIQISRKLRCSKAHICKIVDFYDKTELPVAVSLFVLAGAVRDLSYDEPDDPKITFRELSDRIDCEGNPCTYYKTGCDILPDKFDDNPYDICTYGIHFFENEDDARKHYLGDGITAGRSNAMSVFNHVNNVLLRNHDNSEECIAAFLNDKM